MAQTAETKYVSEEEYNRITVCGDGKFDAYSEECDGTEGCTTECICADGYTRSTDESGKCVMSCMFNDGRTKTVCEKCISPDTCDKCDTEQGYNEDCHLCKEGYMWMGEGNCMPYNKDDVSSCEQFLLKSKELGEYNKFEIDLTDTDQKEVTIDISNILNLNIPGLNSDELESIMNQTKKLQMNQCSLYSDPTKPYTYGHWFKLTSSVEKSVLIEMDNMCDYASINLITMQKSKQGTRAGMTLQDICPPDTEFNIDVNCLGRNGGFSKYIQSPRIVAKMTKDVPQYLFVHTKYASDNSVLNTYNLYFSTITHVCSSAYTLVDWNEVIGDGFSQQLNFEYVIQSTSVCSKHEMKGFWFLVTGVDTTIDISTCDSKYEYDVNIDVVEVDISGTDLSMSSTDLTSLDCGNSSTSKCVKSRTDGCGANSSLARAVVKLNPSMMYFVFIGINEEFSAIVNLNISQICPNDCGEHGVCSSYSAKCECDETNGYVYKDKGCTRCGNGIIDDDEECDLSNMTDPMCTKSCTCSYGTVPMVINGIRKCAPQTCGNGQIDAYEECDGGRGCDHCVCVKGTKYARARTDCLQTTCGNKQWDEGEECDGGDGCVECECQDGWYDQGKVDCRKVSQPLYNFLFWGVAAIFWVILYIVLFAVFFPLFLLLTRRIKQEMEDEKLVIFENTIIPFDKTNSQYIDLSKENPYFHFSSNNIDFNDVRPEINEPIDTQIMLTNNWKDNMHFTFHSGDYTKYEIMCKPFTGTIRPKETVTLTISFMAKCTTLLNEKVPITIRYGSLQNIIREIKRENPDMIAQNSQSSQNSESDARSLSSNSSSRKTNSKVSAPKSGSESKKKHGKSKVSKFHVYLSLQVESALSTKLDYEEIHLQHPPIGGGTFGIVYRAEWRRVDVAVKVMKTDLVGLAELLPNFMQEAEMMERIRCPYIVNFIGSVVTTDTLCLVTEFCPLGSLRKFMRTNAMSEMLKIRFCQDIAKGMEYLHQNDILHRDLKTDNVLVYSKNPHDPITAKVTDFGTSRSFIESSSKVALQNIGTPVYMAPEINKKEKMTLKSDVYSFAICMLEVWLGRDPYDPAKFPDSESILRYVGAGKRLEIASDCILKDIIQQAWDQNPAVRPTFKEIGYALDAIYKKISDKNRSDSGNHSGSSKTRNISSTGKITETTTATTTTTNTTTQTEESIEATVSTVDNDE